ncbi:MAG: FAD-dependent monooxygenase [Pseudonocardiales bacterium]|nr:FAD-dependent monooxygenase [Pseudonocardiales bacterium]MBV9030939.1 FAD-dependent monooxygenase [Pseudonocardiales bacterium]
MTDSTVLIVGAGPTGLALACGLRGQGISVRVVDSATGPAGTSRALGVQPRGVEVLIRLGALGDLPERAILVDEVRMYVGRRLVSTMPLERMGSASGRSPLLISQAAIEGELRRRLTELDGHVDWGHRLADAEQDATGVTATLQTTQGHETVRADWLIGCDGAHSKVRKLAGIGFPGTAVAECFLLADVLASWEIDRHVTTSWTDGADMISVCPLPGANRCRLMGPAPAGTIGELSDEEVRALIRRQLTKCSIYRDEEIEEVEWLSSFRIHRRLADSYRKGRMLLAGDAAAIHHPFGGQGMNTGLGDAENLAWKLGLVAGGRANDQLLDSYQAERRPIASGVVAATSMTTRLVMADTPVIRQLRDRLVLPLMNHPKTQNLLWRNASQLGIHYRGGPLATKPKRFSSGPRPGERVPDIACRHTDGTPTLLHEALNGRWALLTGAGNEDSVTTAENRLGKNNVVVLTPADAQLTDLLLIRPDAHLAWRGHPASATLSHWLADALERGTAS